MTHKYINLKVWSIPLTGLIIGIIALYFLPEQIPLHWDSTGAIDRMGGKWTILLLPGISMLVLLLGHIVPVIDPKREAYKQFTREYNLIHLLVMLALLAAEIYVILTSLGMAFDSLRFAALLAGALLAAIGNYLPKIPQNYLTGIKSIWAFSNNAIWDKMHRMAGRLWFAGGLVMMLLAFFRFEYLNIIKLSIIALLILLPRLYGLILSRRLSAAQKN